MFEDNDLKLKVAEYVASTIVDEHLPSNVSTIIGRQCDELKSTDDEKMKVFIGDLEAKVDNTYDCSNHSSRRKNEADESVV